MTNISKETKEALELGYKTQCDILKELVTRRLNKPGNEILLQYIKDNKTFVDDYCAKHRIDHWVVMQDKQAMFDLGEALITKDIQLKTLNKQIIDKDLESLEIKTISLENDINTKSVWLSKFGAARNNKELSHRSNKILRSPNIPTEIAEEITKAVEFIKDKYTKDLEPNTLRPDSSLYWDIVEYPMSAECEQYISKFSGN
jgi:hypothetical protein